MKKLYIVHKRGVLIGIYTDKAKALTKAARNDAVVKKVYAEVAVQ